MEIKEYKKRLKKFKNLKSEISSIIDLFEQGKNDKEQTKKNINWHLDIIEGWVLEL